jgi:hypothetical protein
LRDKLELADNKLNEVRNKFKQDEELKNNKLNGLIKQNEKLIKHNEE